MRNAFLDRNRAATRPVLFFLGDWERGGSRGLVSCRLVHGPLKPVDRLCADSSEIPLSGGSKSLAQLLGTAAYIQHASNRAAGFHGSTSCLRSASRHRAASTQISGRVIWFSPDG